MIPGIDDATLDQVDAHTPFVVFIAFVVVLGIVITIEAIREQRAKRRRRAAQALEQQRQHAAGLDAGVARGWHDAPGERRWIS